MERTRRICSGRDTKDEDEPGHGNEGGEQTAESSLYRQEISILLQERKDLGLEKLNQSELESLLAGVLGALEAARGTASSPGLMDVMPSLSTLRETAKPPRSSTGVSGTPRRLFRRGRSTPRLC